MNRSAKNVHLGNKIIRNREAISLKVKIVVIFGEGKGTRVKGFWSIWKISISESE